jgi:hypothetical protein
LPQEVFALLQTILPEMAEDTGRAANVFEKGIYAGRQISKEEADFFLAYTGTLLSNLQKTKILL